MSSPTLYDVAKAASVSPKTVSRVINGESGVRPVTRKKVEDAIAQLGYRPSVMARGLGGAHAYTVGMAYDNPNAYYILAMQQGALSACEVANFGLQMYPTDAQAPDLADKLCHLQQRLRLAGLVLTTPVSERKACTNQLDARGIPFVRIVSAPTNPRRGSPCIYVNDRDAAHDVTTHLLHLGHTRIGFLKGGKHHHASLERLRGYKQALRDYGIEPREEYMVDGDYTFDIGFRGARRLFAMEDRPTAIFGCNDEIAAGALAAAHSVQLDVPNDVSIVGFEDSAFSRHSWPPITTARQPADTIAQRATEMLIQMIGGDTPANQGFRPELVIRSSSAPPPRAKTRP